MNSPLAETQQSYDRVAAEYAAHIFDELRHKPFDRAMLDCFGAVAGPVGTVCDLGCGPGQVARYLHDQGFSAVGVDLSPEMIAQARELSPDIVFQQGTMLSLPFDDVSLGGIAAFYSVIHVPRPQLSTVFGEMWRVLRPGGAVLVAFHLGDEDRHLDEWWDQPVSLDFQFFQRPAIEEPLTAAGFRILESVERDAYPEVEHPSRRAYILARKVDDDPLERLRALCLALPEATERLSHGEPTWFVRDRKTFVMYADHHHDDVLAFWCAAPPGAQELLVSGDPERFFRPPYVGHRGWVGVRLDGEVDWDEIGELVIDAYCTVAPKRLLNLLGPPQAT